MRKLAPKLKHTLNILRYILGLSQVLKHENHES